MKKWIVLLMAMAVTGSLAGVEILRINKNESLPSDFEIGKVFNLTFGDYGSDKLRVNLSDGSYHEYDLSSISDLTFSDLTGIEEGSEILTKLGISLLKNYPNPFNPETMIYFRISKEDITKVSIYNHLGQFVTELFNGKMLQGDHTVKWNAQENNASSGVYFVKVSQSNNVVSTKMLLVK
jgi:hypothetical protein